jgi:hypothetical protein
MLVSTTTTREVTMQNPATTITVIDRIVDGDATLTPIHEDGWTVHTVTPTAGLAQHFGCPQHADQVIGGLVRMNGKWSITAYTDRDHLLNNTGPAYYLPNARSRAAAVRALLRWWWMVAKVTDRREAANLNPFEYLSKRDLRNLVA